uniref:Uncharacterized protein n=1 Tax=Lepeophtheirus salmonis TaxID=72036 RepID=A0A0K2VEA6_LEPSM
MIIPLNSPLLEIIMGYFIQDTIENGMIYC